VIQPFLDTGERWVPVRDAYTLSPAEAVDVARLASLRMWDAFDALEGRP